LQAFSVEIRKVNT